MPGYTLTLLALIFGILTAQSQNWPQFRGNDGQGHSSETGLPLEWSESSNVIWKSAVPGLGWSSPVVSNGKVWVTTATAEDEVVSLRAIAYDAEFGREVVNTAVFTSSNIDYFNGKNSLASPTPVLEGDRVYVHFGAQGTAALTTSGEVVWKTRLRYISEHGNGGSPVVHGDLLIINCDGDDRAYVAALDKQTGQARWIMPRREPWAQAYSTPLVIRAGDRDQIVSPGAFRAGAYDPESGEEIWHVNYGTGFSNVPRPIYGHGLVYVASGFPAPSLVAIRPDGKGDVTRTHVAWTINRSVPETSSPLLVDGELYMVSDLGIATCLDAKTGEICWRQRLGGNYSASPIFADGRIYFQSEDGMTTVIAPGREYRRLAQNVLDGTTFASFAVFQKSFIIRSHTHLYRIGVKEQ